MCRVVTGFWRQQELRYNAYAVFVYGVMPFGDTDEEPWCRLHDADTLASSQRNSVHQEHRAPKDSLDFQLQSVYNHHNDSFCSKNQIFYQKKTVSEELRKYEQLKQDMLEKDKEKDGVVWVDPERRAFKAFSDV
ncbi:cilia- and flagella-associated protein 276 [Pseudoliparis swirei]|uniref:cilia- and flagella-associated protein 276 n=1 Tax=Pseudoliparis swirei TaxID=2059687 RepID=UPI0024BE320A|nr:cilia- and flagella-associated protein 276 [Pseudoliparis swirei]